MKIAHDNPGLKRCFSRGDSSNSESNGCAVAKVSLMPNHFCIYDFYHVESGCKFVDPNEEKDEAHWDLLKGKRLKFILVFF